MCATSHRQISNKEREEDHVTGTWYITDPQAISPKATLILSPHMMYVLI